MKANNTMRRVAKSMLWLGFGIATILSMPLVAMQFTSDVQWSASDFLVIGVLLFTIGMAYILVSLKIRDTGYRFLVGGGLLALLLYLWAELAVGIFTNWGS